MNETLLWQIKSGNTYTNMLTPSVFDYEWEDADDDSYRSVVTANLIRERIVSHLEKITIEYHKITSSQVNTIAKAINTNASYTVKCKSPAFGNMTSPDTGETNSWVEFVAYTSKFSCKSTKAGDGSIVYDLSFSVIQKDVGTFNGN